MPIDPTPRVSLFIPKFFTFELPRSPPAPLKPNHSQSAKRCQSQSVLNAPKPVENEGRATPIKPVIPVKTAIGASATICFLQCVCCPQLCLFYLSPNFTNRQARLPSLSCGALRSGGHTHKGRGLQSNWHYGCARQPMVAATFKVRLSLKAIQPITLVQGFTKRCALMDECLRC